jgi:uncharacterized membrane protein YsdA (DUF1294 family)/cold shock CspA family protein
MRKKGKIAAWHDDKGYGFITPLGGGKQVFIHAKAFANQNRRPNVSEVVTYSIAKDNQGRPCAANATLAGDKRKEKSAQQASTTNIIFATGFLVAIALSVVLGGLPFIVLAAYGAASLITFLAYAVDKSAAKRRAWRTPENTLLLLGLVGGWPGALIAREVLRHKSKKSSFRIQLWVTVLMNCAALAWLFTEGGKAAWAGLPG